MISVYVNVKETLVPVGYRRDFQSISNEVCWRPLFQQPAKEGVDLYQAVSISEVFDTADRTRVGRKRPHHLRTSGI